MANVKRIECKVPTVRLLRYLTILEVKKVKADQKVLLTQLFHASSHKKPGSLPQNGCCWRRMHQMIQMNIVSAPDELRDQIRTSRGCS
jgi:hypothetical protein